MKMTENSGIRGAGEGEVISPSDADRPFVEFKAVDKGYDGNTVLDGLSFVAKKGEHLALIGPSGSGKTTILRILMTLEYIDQGSVVIGGEEVFRQSVNGQWRPATEAHLRKMRSKVGFIFQHFNLFPHKSVIENITMAPVLNGYMTPKDAHAKGMELLQMVGLESKADAMPSSISGGQQQRVAIARALALEPEILLCDEITSALDPELVEEVLTIVQRLGSETDITILMVTHEMGFARDFADRVLFLEGGHIVEEGTPKHIFSNPKEERTQSFLHKIITSGRRV